MRILCLFMVFSCPVTFLGAGCRDAELVIRPGGDASAPLDSGVGGRDATAPPLDVGTFDGSVSDVGAPGARDSGEGELSVTLIASDTSVMKGDTITLTWATENAVSCETSWGLEPWRSFTLPDLSSGSFTILINALNTIRFRLTCVGRDGSSVTVIEDVESEPSDAGNDPPRCEAPEVELGDTDTWRDLFGDFFPERTILQKTVQITRGKSYAVRFNTGSFDGRGTVKTIPGNPGALRDVAINPCPGRFSDSTQGCFESHSLGGSANLVWSTDGSTECLLLPDTEYYLNVTHTDPVTGRRRCLPFDVTGYDFCVTFIEAVKAIKN